MSGLVIYPGSFDPITYGHLDVAARAAALFDELVVAVSHNVGKTSLFSVEERIELAAQALADIPNARVSHFQGLLVDFCRRCGARAVVRGLRAVSDFEYEFQMALTNRHLAGEKVDTVFLMPNEDHIYLSSSLVKEIARFGGAISSFVPPNVERALRARLKEEP